MWISVFRGRRPEKNNQKTEKDDGKLREKNIWLIECTENDFKTI